jgi:L-lactate dehydrogenase
MSRFKIAAIDWADMSGSAIVILTAGARQKPGESRLELNERNRAIMKSTVPSIVAFSPQCVLIVVSNPCDIMAKLVADLALFPPGRVFGSGTYLDSSRFRSFVSKKINIDSSHVHATVIGEHGDSSVLLASSATCGGTLLTNQPHEPGGHCGGAPQRGEQRARHHLHQGL